MSMLKKSNAKPQNGKEILPIEDREALLDLLNKYLAHHKDFLLIKAHIPKENSTITEQYRIVSSQIEGEFSEILTESILNRVEELKRKSRTSHKDAYTPIETTFIQNFISNKISSSNPKSVISFLSDDLGIEFMPIQDKNNRGFLNGDILFANRNFFNKLFKGNEVKGDKDTREEDEFNFDDYILLDTDDVEIENLLELV